MKKVIAFSSILLGAMFLAGCSLGKTSQIQPATPAPAAQEPTQSAPTTSNSQSYIEVNELDFKIPVDPAMADDLTYKINLSGAAAFSSKTLTAANKSCGDGKSGPTIEKIQGSTIAPRKGDPVFYKAHISDTQQFEGYFLFYRGSQDSCTLGRNVELEKKVAEAVSDGFKNVSLMSR